MSEKDASTKTGHYVHRELDTDQTTPSDAVVEIIAEIEGKEPTDLKPIYSTIDHVLQHIFENPPSEESQAQIQFHYEGYQVTVHHSGAATFLKL